MGIEPTSSAWKAEVLPLNYTRLALPGPVRAATPFDGGITHKKRYTEDSRCRTSDAGLNPADFLPGSSHRSSQPPTPWQPQRSFLVEGVGLFALRAHPFGARRAVQDCCAILSNLIFHDVGSNPTRAFHNFRACQFSRGPGRANSGGGGRIRTYVGIASRFTVCPR